MESDDTREQGERGGGWRIVLAVLLMALMILPLLLASVNSGGFLAAGLLAAVGGGLILLLAHYPRLLRLVAWLGRRLPGGEPSHEESDEPFPPSWEQTLRDNVFLYSRLSPAEQARLHGLIRGFLEGKSWEGCNGLEITDEVRLTIAAQACVLLLGTIDHDHFASVRSILVYPTTFGTPRHGEGVEDQVATLGQAWYRGPVILAWDEVLHGGRHPDGGRNVVHHEFAHQLDFQGRSLEEAVPGAAARRVEHWAEVLHTEYEALVAATRHHQHTLLDPYGATNPREFFAVASECFFGRPGDLERTHPELYTVLREFYGQDPAERHRRSLHGTSVPHPHPHHRRRRP